MIEQRETFSPAKRVTERAALPDNFLGQPQEIFACVLFCQVGDQMGLGPACHLVHNFGAQHVCRAIFDFAELRADFCLKREASQKGRTKRVDRLNFQTTRGFNRAGKQRARIRQLTRICGAFDAQVCQFRTQFIIRQHRPITQTLEQPVLHLGCGSFGVGQAQDVLRLHAFQQ